MGLANEGRRYYVTPALIGRAHTQNDPWTTIEHRQLQTTDACIGLLI